MTQISFQSSEFSTLVINRLWLNFVLILHQVGAFQLKRRSQDNINFLQNILKSFGVLLVLLCYLYYRSSKPIFVNFVV